MCSHDDERLVERAQDGDGYTDRGEQLLKCRVCDDTRIAYLNT